jgi:hypothetical protein
MPKKQLQRALENPPNAVGGFLITFRFENGSILCSSSEFCFVLLPMLQRRGDKFGEHRLGVQGPACQAGVCLRADEVRVYVARQFEYLHDRVDRVSA